MYFSVQKYKNGDGKTCDFTIYVVFNGGGYY